MSVKSLFAERIWYPEDRTYDCTDLPESMNSAATNERGCPGAVWGDGNPSFDYCTNTGWNQGNYPWWENCCKWDVKYLALDGQCVPKELETGSTQGTGFWKQVIY